MKIFIIITELYFHVNQALNASHTLFPLKTQNVMKMAQKSIMQQIYLCGAT